MILNGFTDTDGWLHWCRHRESPDKIHRARPAEVFHKNHLYSTQSESGIKDPAMERTLAVLESKQSASFRRFWNRYDGAKFQL